MFKRSMFLSILAIGVIGVACPSKTDDDGDDGGNNDTITIDNVMEHYVTAQCEHEIGCASEYALGDLTQAECETFLSADMGEGPDPTLYSINETAARACLDKVAAAPCGEHFNPDFDADCRAAIVGSLAAGSCCDDRDGCGPDLRCDIADPDTGTCVATSVAGGDCDRDADCELGLFCDSSTDTCATLVQSGGDCTNDEQCAHTFCNDGTCGLSAFDGESCANVSCFDMSWLTCVGSTEQCTPWAGLGQTCDAAGDTAPECNFADNLWCDSGTCAARPTLGGDCTVNSWCASGLYCDISFAGGDDTCKTRLGQGETCNPGLGSHDCDDHLECDGNTNTCEPSQATCQ